VAGSNGFLSRAASLRVTRNAFGSRGKPGWSPSRLALVTVLQRAENLTDRLAAGAVPTRIDWKYLLGLSLDDPGFDHTGQPQRDPDRRTAAPGGVAGDDRRGKGQPVAAGGGEREPGPGRDRGPGQAEHEPADGGCGRFGGQHADRQGYVLQETEPFIQWSVARPSGGG
jgi:hypothetical protein